MIVRMLILPDMMKITDMAKDLDEVLDLVAGEGGDLGSFVDLVQALGEESDEDS